jgi:hypothetical protein
MTWSVLAVALLLIACSTQRGKITFEPTPPCVHSHVGLRVKLVPNEDPSSPALLQVADGDHLKHGNALAPHGSAELLPVDLRASDSNVSTRWTSGNQIVTDSADLTRAFTVSRATRFEGGSPDLQVAETRWSMMRPANGDAIRVRMDRPSVLSRSVEVPRLPLTADKTLPGRLHPPLRFMLNRAPTTETITFTEALDPAQGGQDFFVDDLGQVSAVPGSAPHSIEFHLIPREDLNQSRRKCARGLSLFELVDPG